MLHVLSVAYRLAPVHPRAVGGAEQVLARLDRALVASGHQSTVLACAGSRGSGALSSVPIGEGPFDDGRRRRVAQLFVVRLEQLLSERAFDVVHFHGVDVASYPFDSGALRRVPKLVTLHLPFDWYPPELFRPRPNLDFNVVSEWQRASLSSRVALRATIPNGVDLCEWRPAREPAGGYVLCLGRICHEKGFDIALRAARAARVPLVLAGEVFAYPEHERYFSEQVAPLLDAERRFIGPVSGAAKRRWLANADAVIVPSRVAETCSLVTLEALACGTPVITSDAGAPPSLIEHGVSGFVAGDELGFVDALRRVGRLGRADCRRRAARFDVRETEQRYLALYTLLAREKQRAAPPHAAAPP
jgi:glycosyltransferase involved in cell wall biosynthesis